MKIHAPNREFTGEQTYGTTVIKFEEGVAEVDELSPSIRQYLVGAGYGIDADPTAAPDDVDLPDPHATAVFYVGTPLADASAVRVEDGPPPAPDAADEAPLKGKDLDAALDAVGLPKTGTADEKRARLAEHADAAIKAAKQPE